MGQPEICNPMLHTSAKTAKLDHSNSKCRMLNGDQESNEYRKSIRPYNPLP
jgi:hypothetical protein